MKIGLSLDKHPEDISDDDKIVGVVFWPLMIIIFIWFIIREIILKVVG
jgi:hypothetical protein